MRTDQARLFQLRVGAFSARAAPVSHAPPLRRYKQSTSCGVRLSAVWT